MKRWHRHSDAITRSRRWRAVRMQALRRDGFQCVQCGVRHRLEVDHVLSVRDRPDLSFDPGNLQVLCGGCHTRKTRVEVGHPELSPERRKWRDLVAGMRRNPIEHERKSDA